MNLFAESDRQKLVASPSLFDREFLREKHGDWGHQLLRAATAMEILSQITERNLSVLLKGGTLLQHSLEWPPYRASVDVWEAVEDPKASTCPSSISPYAVRRGSITHHLKKDVPETAVSDRANVSQRVLDHLDRRTEREKMEQRRQYLEQL